MTQTPPRRAPAPTKWRRHRNPRLSFLSPVNNKSTRDRSSPNPNLSTGTTATFDSSSIPSQFPSRTDVSSSISFQIYFLLSFSFSKSFFFVSIQFPPQKKGGGRDREDTETLRACRKPRAEGTGHATKKEEKKKHLNDDRIKSTWFGESETKLFYGGGLRNNLSGGGNEETTKVKERAAW